MSELNHLLQILSVVILLFSLFLVLVTLVRYRPILVKLVALEVMVNLFIGAIGLWALHVRQSLMLDICIPLALIMFLATVAYCQFLIKRKHQDV